MQMLTKTDEYKIAQMALNYDETFTEIGNQFGVDRKVVSRRKNKYINLTPFEKQISDYFQKIHTYDDSLYEHFTTIGLTNFIFNKMCDHADWIIIQDHVNSWRKDKDNYRVFDLKSLVDAMKDAEESHDYFESREVQEIYQLDEIGELYDEMDDGVDDELDDEMDDDFLKTENTNNTVIVDYDGVVNWNNAPDSSFNYFIEEPEYSFIGSDFHKKEYDDESGRFTYVDSDGSYYPEYAIDYNQKIYKKPETNNALYTDILDKYLSSDEVIDVEYDAVITPSSIDITEKSLQADGEIKTDQRVISSGNPQFRKAWQIIRDNEGELNQETLQDIYEVADIRSYIGKITEGNLEIDFDNETAHYKNYPIGENMVRRIIREAFDENTNQVNRKIVNFFEKVLENPSERSVNNLYDFLKHNDIKIDENGDIIGYKMVRPDRYDQFSGTFYNGDGETIWMPRHEVDCDPDHTCSRGLHVCASRYLGFFANTITIMVRVSPRDVCAVPYDYDGSKMRVNQYIVIGVAD